LAERRAKDSGWRDVAGILRSLDYALAAGRPAPASPTTSEYDVLADAISARFPERLLAAYRAAAGLPQGGGDRQRDADLLRLFLIEKAAYEVLYELGNRPDWLTVPLTGLARLVDAVAVPETGDAA
jgi:maltose alpha-D-glucosyltransferase/alpha-amylase